MLDADISTVFETLFTAALDGAPDGGGLMAYNYLSGEPITDLEEGRPLFLRSPDSAFDLATFMRVQLFASLATLRIGMDVLQKDEGVRLERMFAHGGLFKTKGVAQRFLAAAIDTPVSVGDVAAEGGAWGIATLAAFTASRDPEQSLGDYLNSQVFADARLQHRNRPSDVAGFDSSSSATSPPCRSNDPRRSHLTSAALPVLGQPGRVGRSAPSTRPPSMGARIRWPGSEITGGRDALVAAASDPFTQLLKDGLLVVAISGRAPDALATRRFSLSSAICWAASRCVGVTGGTAYLARLLTLIRTEVGPVSRWRAIMDGRG